MTTDRNEKFDRHAGGPREVAIMVPLGVVVKAIRALVRLFRRRGRRQ